ncbi:MAG: hypothetical protein ACLGSD_18730 [Acidobacteriota bacterium]
MGMVLGLAVTMSGAPKVNAQQYHGLPQVDMSPPVVQNDPSLTMSTPEGRALIAKRVKALNTMRQKTLVSDTEKLLKLAQELNAADGTKMSAAERVKKLAQIQKLAKQVREKMSYAQWFAPVVVPSTYSVQNP